MATRRRGYRQVVTQPDPGWAEHPHDNPCQQKSVESSRTRTGENLKGNHYSRVIYGLPYATLTNTQSRRLKAELRKCYRIEMGVPRYAQSIFCLSGCPTQHSQRRAPAHREAQQHCFRTCHQGRNILYVDTTSRTCLFYLAPLHRVIPLLTILPMPLNMNPKSHQRRRQTRADHLTTPPHTLTM